jgi:hypothetical protein
MPGYLRPEPETNFNASYFDPVGKLRTSQAQALIDTDFEYGMQTSKWENLELINNRPFSFSSSNSVTDITSILFASGSNNVTVETTIPHGLSVGVEIVVQDTFLTIANGNFIVESVPSTTTFVYRAKAKNVSTTLNQIFDSNKTTIYVGTTYTNSRIGGTPALSYSGNFVSVETTVPHGLAIGNEIAIVGISTNGTNPPNGSFFVTSVVNESTFRFYAPNTPTGTLSGGQVYVRPQAQFLHRPFDGGILFSANASSNNQQAIRQTRRYFRYQSGKGIQASSGTVLKPNLSIESLTAAGNLITVKTKEQHNIQPGTTIKVFGANEEEYNGTFSVITITGYNTFTYESATPPANSKASGFYYVVVDSWFGCQNLLGLFDSQNGMFFEYDGSDLYVVKRSSTFQISGRVSVTQGSNTVTQTDPEFGTNFSNQLRPGNFIVIRGQSYRVESIASDTTMTITPSYRGASADFVQVAVTVDQKIKQQDWNLDTMDGNGPSGFTLDLTKMQMFYIDYSWYGAGFVRWGLRGIDGTVYYVHKMLNNNTNSEAYMRSGNLPARYESNTFNKVATITQTIQLAATEIFVESTAGFPESGTLMIRGGAAYEFVNYDGITANSFQNVIREKNGATIDVTIAAGSNTGTIASVAGIQVGQRVISSAFPDNTYLAELNGNTVKFNTAALTSNPEGVVFAPLSDATARQFVYSPTSPVSVELAFPTYSASISHWGTSVIMDGNFDEDKSLLFTFGQTKFINVPSLQTVTDQFTGAAGSKTVTVGNGSQFEIGMAVNDFSVGFQNGTTVTDIASNTLTLSLPITETLSSASRTFSGGNSRALFSIRVAPSVDNGIAALFGQRELINRMQLTLRNLDVTTSTAGANVLVTAVLNGATNGSTLWTNAVRNSTTLFNSSLAQVADFQEATTPTIVLGGEVTGGFYVNGTTSIGLENVRDLGNSILGGGGSSTSTSIYPDGPDVLSIVVTNLSEVDVDVLGRLSWSEAQA